MIEHDTILNCLAYGSHEMMSILLGKCHFGLAPSNVIAFLLKMPFADPEDAVAQLTSFIDTAQSDKSIVDECITKSRINIAHYVSQNKKKQMEKLFFSL